MMCGGLRAAACHLLAAMAMVIACGVSVLQASTYVVMIPLDSTIYDELDSLNGLGYLDTYFPEIKPISRVEAARLTLEAERNMRLDEHSEPLAVQMTRVLDEQLSEEVGWLRDNREDDAPPLIASFDRLEAQYAFTRGVRRYWNTGQGIGTSIHASEGTPLLDDADGIPTASGSNEVMRAGGWIGAGDFLTLYGEGAVAGPITRQVNGQQRFMPISAESVVSLGNQAISFGLEEKRWGTGYFAALSQGANAQPFPGVTWQNIHPKYLPWFLRYLGPGRRQIFMGQLDGSRPIGQHPWLVGHILVFKPLPWFEFGYSREIMFGGHDNDHYGFSGFLGRFTGIDTGNATNGNTKSRGEIFLRFTIPRLRGLQIYQGMLGSDNLTGEIPGIGRFIPFKSVSYQGGFYLPRLTQDGLTDLRFEYALLESNYDQHGSGEYWVYQNQLMADPLGPNATQVNLMLGRWFNLKSKLSGELF